MRIVNLLPDDYTAARVRRRAFSACLALFPVILSGTVVSVLISGRTSDRARTAQDYVARSRGDAAKAMRTFQQAESRRAEALTEARRNATLLQIVPASHILTAIAAAMPERTTLTRLELQGEALGAGAGGRGATSVDRGGKTPGGQLTIVGLADTDVAVANLIAALSRHPLVATARLEYSQDKPGARRIREFRVFLILKSDVDVLSGICRPDGQRRAREGTDDRAKEEGRT